VLAGGDYYAYWFIFVMPYNKNAEEKKKINMVGAIFVEPLNVSFQV
jgi:hypothetical protein